MQRPDEDDSIITRARNQPRESPTKFPWPGSTPGVRSLIRPSEKEAVRLGSRSQLRLDRVEIGRQLATHALDRRNDRNRDTGGDQSVFDGGSARLVSEKLLENHFQFCLHFSWGRSNVHSNSEHNLRFSESHLSNLSYTLVLRNTITICNLKQNTDFGSEQNVRATLLFVDPMSDIAMLGEPGAQELFDECHRYSTFTEAIEPMSRNGE
jgi:hypothetical protein